MSQRYNKRMPPRGKKRVLTRPVLYQLCRAGERFEVGDGPRDLSETEDLVLGRGEPARSGHNRYYVDDPWMSSKHARLARRDTGSAQWTIEDAGSTNGVVVNGETIKHASLRPGDLIETGRTFWLYLEEPGDLAIPDDPVEFGTWATWSPQLAEQLRMLTAHADTGEHILICGPTGTGKGYLARTVHLMSERRGRFVHLDCRERRPKRLEVDLFGGDGQRARIREADLGTLFLENAEALPSALQQRICETLDQGTLSSRGKRTRIDVRVIASTTLRPDRLIANGQMSSRFSDTVGEIQFNLPGLVNRGADLGLLVDDFLARARGAPAISRDACRFVLRHQWRLQVKALASVIESASVLATEFDDKGNRGGRIEPRHLPVEVIGDAGLRALVPTPNAMDRPPSALYQTDERRAEPDDERTSEVGEKAPVVASARSTKAKPAARTPQASRQVPKRSSKRSSSSSTNTPSPDFLDEVRQVEAFVDNFDALDATDPGLHVDEKVRDQMSSRQSTKKPAASTAALPLQGDGALTPSRPPSAYHDIESIERSYANAVDPELIVESLRRARGNVSAAARYLGKPRALVLKWMREFQIDPYDFRDG